MVTSVTFEYVDVCGERCRYYDKSVIYRISSIDERSSVVPELRCGMTNAVLKLVSIDNKEVE